MALMKESPAYEILRGKDINKTILFSASGGGGEGN
jgi:hypothetical protein